MNGVVTNYEFENRLSSQVSNSLDQGVQAIHSEAWRLYDDHREHRLSLEPAVRRTLERWLLFLDSDLEYEWRELSPSLSWLLVLPNVLCLGLLGRLLWRRTARQGDETAWPFIRQDDPRGDASDQR